PSASLVRDARGTLRAEGTALVAGGFLDNLQAWFTRESVRRDDSAHGLPFTSGWVVYLGYEIAAEIEPTLRLPAPTSGITAFALRVEHLAVHDLATDQVFAVSPAHDRARHQRLIEALRSAAAQPLQEPQPPLPLAALAEEPAERHLARVRAAKEYIAAGDIYQANLSRPWHLRLRDVADAPRVYTALRAANPAPFAASVHFGGMTILSSSPERLLRIEGREVSTRPIAGTRARLGDDQQQQRDRAELVGHPKERAEHIMLIDLERNDL